MENMATKTYEENYRINLRRMRADALLAAVLDKIRPFLNEDCEKDAYYALLEFFIQEGVEVLTDYHRKEMGLPSRDGEGWTPKEVHALELKRMEELLAPFKPFPLGL